MLNELQDYLDNISDHNDVLHNHADVLEDHEVRLLQLEKVIVTPPAEPAEVAVADAKVEEPEEGDTETVSETAETPSESE